MSLALPDPREPLESGWHSPVHGLFARTAQRDPGGTAVRDGRTSWTYAELDRNSNRLAHYLIARGICRQDVVAVHGHRGVELVWAILGILKAGAAFAVLDSAYPPQRLASCLRVTKAKGWVATRAAGPVPQPLQEALAALRPLCELELCAGQADRGPLGECSAQAPEVAVGPEDLAYVLFTSGTTGGPKGIAGPHRPLPHFLEWHCSTFGFTREDRFSMLSGLAHDPLLRDIFTPLVVGATLCIPAQEIVTQPDRLLVWLRDEAISVAHLTPALAQLLAQGPAGAEARPALPRLRQVFFGGDRLRRRTVADLKALAPSVRCVNFYGCTETPQAMAYYVVPDPSQGDRDAPDAAQEPVPLGKGIRDVQLLVLTGANQLAGVEEVGEICVRTPYLARGYLGDEKQTGERFLVNPFTGSPADRVYRTGDLGRYLPDGTVVFCGRADHQVKVRGFRVELEEVEAVLLRHAGLKQAVIVAHAHGPDEMRLTACTVAAEPPGPSSQELRAFLLERLPPYMVPAHFVRVESLPLTPNGKVDRRALPLAEPAAGQRPVDRPRDPVEAQLVSLWEEVLGLHPVGVKDNFFELGGHSLQVAQLFAEIARVFGRNYPLATLFQAPTVAQLAGILRQAEWSPSWASLVAIQPGTTPPPLYCVHAGGGNVLSFIPLVRQLGPEQPVYGLQAQGLDGERPPYTTIEDMAAHYVREIRAFQPDGPYRIGGFSFGGVVAFEMAQQLHAQGQQVALLALLDTWFPRRRKPLGQRAAAHLRHFLRLGPKGKLDYVKQRLRRLLGKRPSEASPEPDPTLPAAFQRVNELNTQARLKYVPRPYPGRVTYFRAMERTVWDDEDVGSTWGKVAAGGLEVYEVPGNHDTFHEQEKNVRVLAEQLAACLRRARAGSPRVERSELLLHLGGSGAGTADLALR